MVMRMVLVAAVAGAGFAVPARAQPAAPASAPDKTSAARKYTSEGVAAQDAGDYDTAIQKFTAAYELVAHPVLMFNLGQAHRLASHVDEAIGFYRKYLAVDPVGLQAPAAREFLAELEARKAEEIRKAEAARKAAAASEAANQPARDGAAPGADVSTTTAITSVAAPGRNLRIAGLAAAGAGVVSLGFSLGYALKGGSLNTELEAMYDVKKEREGHRANTIAYVTGVSGVLLIAAGAGLTWWGYRERNLAEHVAVIPMLTGQVAGLTVSGSL